MTDDDGGLAEARYARMRWNTPLSQPHAALLLERLDVRPGQRLLDLGCGWGELLLRAVAAHQSDGVTGTGVDTDEPLLARGRRRAGELGVDGQVTFVQQEAATWVQPADRVLNVGSSHAWAGVPEALAAMAGLVEPGGRLLFGEGYWQVPPSAAAEELFGARPTLDGLVTLADAAGWRVLHLSTVDQREFDDFETTWRAGRQEWLLAHRDDERSGELQAWLDARLLEYLTVYRGVLGFAYLVLAR